MHKDFKRAKRLALSFSFMAALSSVAWAQSVSKIADQTAQYAVKTYQQDAVNSLAKLVSFNTVAKEGTPSTENPVHIAFKNELKKQALSLGLDYQDKGYLVIIGLGNSRKRVGIITHGDVQPVNPAQ